MRENGDLGNVNEKINEITKDFEKQNYNVIINKEAKKTLNKSTKNMMLSKPGSKLGFINENIGNEVTAKLTKAPDKIKYKNSFTKQYGQVNNDYKKNKK